MERVEAQHKRVEYLVTGEFREGPGYATWRSHGTEDWLLIYTVGGAGRFGFRNGQLRVEVGDAVLLRPGTLHDYGTAEPGGYWHLLFSHFHPRPHWHRWLQWPEQAPGLLHLRVEEALRPVLQKRFRAADRLRTGMGPLAVDLALNALEEVLIRLAECRPDDTAAALDSRVQLAMAYVLEHLGKPLALSTVARAGGLSVSRLAHLFKEQVGNTPQQFIEQRRMIRARELLRFTDRPVKEIAYHVGYLNPFYFSLRFRRETGDSPTAYRARALGPDRT